MKRLPYTLRCAQGAALPVACWVRSGSLLHFHYMQNGGKVKCLAHRRRETCSKCWGELVSRSIVRICRVRRVGMGVGQAEGQEGAETEPQAPMQAPRGDFPRGAANIALRGKGAERTPRALVARRTGICLCSRRDGVRDGSGNRAAGADASTPRGFPTGCCEYRLAARWWRCGESNPGPDDH